MAAYPLAEVRKADHAIEPIFPDAGRRGRWRGTLGEEELLTLFEAGGAPSTYNEQW